MLQAGGGVLAPAEQLAGAGVDEDRLAGRPLDEEDAGRQVGHQGVEHARGAAQVDGQRALFGDVGDDAFPAAQPALGVEVRRQHVADPARRRWASSVRTVGTRRIAFTSRGATGPGGTRRSPAGSAGSAAHGGQDDFAVLGVDALEPALVVAEQLFGRAAEQRSAGGADQRHLGGEAAAGPGKNRPL